jgi:putative acetyltransferase
MSIIKIFAYESDYLIDLFDLFWETVHSVNAEDYTNEQLETWAPEQTDTEKWKNRIENNFVVIAKMGNKIVGFSELSPKGCIDMLYVHKDYLRQKVGQQLLEYIIQKAKNVGFTEVFTEASITARPFFEKQGFKLIKKQVKTINTVDFINYKMKKGI